MILSDRTIREHLEAGRIRIEPLGDNAIQPSSVDIRLDSSFRVFLNHTRTVIDVKEDLSDLTQQVDIAEGEAFILHPGEFVLGSTHEVITLPNDIVARIEGKSSLARLGLLIHSSLPGSEPVYVIEDGCWVARPIEEVVRKQLDGHVVSFDPDTFEVGFHQITGWFEGPADRIYEIELASGRRVHVTAGHNLFTLDRDGALTKVRTGELRSGTKVAVPGPTATGRAAEALSTMRTARSNRLYRAELAIAVLPDPRDLATLAWDEVAAVRDTGRVETIYDIEVRPGGRKIENFLAGHGGVFVSNTAGFIDPGFSGHITLELANVATLPITLYPGMKIGQLSFQQMTTPADVPYGSPELGSKYHGQRGPTPSRYFENFARDDQAE